MLGPTMKPQPSSAPLAFALGRCSLGLVLVAHRDGALCAVLLGDARDALLADLAARFPAAPLRADDPAAAALLAATIARVESPRGGPDLPLAHAGTAFQRSVWAALREIPPGRTATYAELARRLGAPRAVRAVAGACAANPWAVLVPCHRVLRADGGLAGYRWGLERKRALLAREAAA
jgi:AraC family transcriptional regulator, regulatory protein of adaptative response / methylated-DNA-[protein]-cysteine methyltransferase